MARKAQAAATAVRSRESQPAKAVTPPADDATSGAPPRTIAEGRRLIDTAYDLASRFVFQTILVDCQRSSLRTIKSFAFFPDDDDAASLLARWDRHRQRTLGELATAFENLKALKVETERAFEPIRPILNFAAAELKTLEIDGGTFQHAFGVLWFHFYKTEQLFHQANGIYSQPRIEPFHRGLQMAYESIERDVMSVATQDALMHRITEERSRLARDLPAYLAYAADETRPPASDTPTSGEAKQPEASDLSALKPCERKAYLAHQYAEMKLGRRLRDREAWEYLDEHGIGDDGEGLTGYDLLLDTFRDYMNRARRKLGEPKYTPRAGRADGARSVRKWSDI
jgi:hypothetical protein